MRSLRNATTSKTNLPSGGHVVALAEAYFDESGTGDDSRFLCIAGYIFTKQKAEALSVEWRSMLDKYSLSYFRMVDCAHGAGEFSNLTVIMRDKVARQAIELTKKYASRGLAVSLDKVAFSHFSKQYLWNTPYSLLAGQMLFGVRLWAEKSGHEGNVSYLFEAGADGAGDLVNAFGKIRADALLESEYRLGCVSFPKKRDLGAEPLQCADLLAWHWNTHQKRIGRGLKTLRKDFDNLLQIPSGLNHYDEAALKAFHESDIYNDSGTKGWAYLSARARVSWQ